MAKKITIPTPRQPLELIIHRDDAKMKIKQQIEKGQEYKSQKISSNEEYETLNRDFDRWDSFNEELLKRIFTTDELSVEYAQTINLIGFLREPALSEKISELNSDIAEKIHRLESITDRLELIPIHVSVRQEIQQHQAGIDLTKNKKVFVVHGRDEIAKSNLEIFLHENNLVPVVLHRMADEGMTIIEKFERNSDVGYAFILLTPDEVAYLKDDELKPDSERKKEYRARPNVIFEFGYFIGRLGRSRVCCLYTGNVTIPSDLNGLVYKHYDTSIEEVAYSIIKDLRAAGYAV